MGITDVTGLGKLIESEVAKKAYGDVLAPAATELGKMGGDVVKAARLLLFPIQMMGNWQDRYASYLKSIVDAVPEERRVEAPPSIAGPALQSMYFLEDGNPLQELYLNLLRRVIDRDRQHEAHPAFPKIIEQMSPDEAVLLCYIKSCLKHRSMNYAQPNWSYIPIVFWDGPIDTNCVVPPPSRPPISPSGEYVIPIDGLVYPQRMKVHISRLRQIEIIKWDGNMLDDDDYSTQSWCAGFMTLTPFGKLFVNACVPDVEFLPDRQVYIPFGCKKPMQDRP
ncbi:MAG: DUF4393 domain-containing protein [Phycisphaerae bacterium]